MQLSAKWIIVGVVTERRELKSEKNKNWRGYVAKVASIGATFEIQLSDQQYAKIGEGEAHRFSGRFDEQAGRQRFVCMDISSADEAAPAGKAGVR